MKNDINEQIVFQPIGIEKGDENLEKTVNNFIDLEEIRTYIKENQYKKLLEVYPNKLVKLWGVQGGKKDNYKISKNVSKWDKIKIGATVLFYSKEKFIKSAKVTFILWNKEIAKHLWNIDSQKETWEYLYFIDNVKDIDINATEIFTLINTKENHVQGLRVFEDDRSEKILNRYKNII